MASLKVKPILLLIPLILNRRRFLRRIAKNHFKDLILRRERQKIENNCSAMPLFGLWFQDLSFVWSALSRILGEMTGRGWICYRSFKCNAFLKDHSKYLTAVMEHLIAEHHGGEQNVPYLLSRRSHIYHLGPRARLALSYSQSLLFSRWRVLGRHVLPFSSFCSSVLELGLCVKPLFGSRIPACSPRPRVIEQILIRPCYSRVSFITRFVDSRKWAWQLTWPRAVGRPFIKGRCAVIGGNWT